MTTPRTWVVGEVVTAALMNTEIRDQFNSLMALQPTTIVKAADEAVTSSTTLQNDNHLAFTLAASATYVFDGAIYYDGVFNAGNLKAGWTLPAAATILWSLNAPATGGAAALDSSGVTSGTIAVGTYGTGGAKTTASIKGTVITTTNGGTLQFQWAQNASNATATTIYAKSWINLRRVA